MDNEVNVLLSAVRRAGDAIVKLQPNEMGVMHKANKDILTQADLLANEILKSELLGHFPEDGWLSEESVDDARRLSCYRVWIVDPIDGTKEYATGIPEYAISVALVEDGFPVLAAVYNPAKQEFFHAIKNGGAWLNGQSIQCKALAGEKFVLLASRSECDRGEWEQFQALHDVRIVGSIAYKLALIAAGRADATFSLGCKNEWDIAAGVLLIVEAGGHASDQQGVAFRFNQKNTLVSGIVGVAANMKQDVFALFR